MVDEGEVWMGMPVRILGHVGRTLRQSKNHRGHKHVTGIVSGAFWDGCRDDMVRVTIPGRRVHLWLYPDEIERRRK